eukprot:2194364-Amphidinium_carterae.1
MQSCTTGAEIGRPGRATSTPNRLQEAYQHGKWGRPVLGSQRVRLGYLYENHGRDTCEGSKDLEIAHDCFSCTEFCVQLTFDSICPMLGHGFPILTHSSGTQKGTAFLEDML